MDGRALLGAVARSRSCATIPVGSGSRASFVYIPFRANRDPRELRILDPACGSGHFLLYSFDLLAAIYEEAYDDPAFDLQSGFPDRGAFRGAVPRLIIEHDLHGIDIDLRSTQIAALALWLRAHRAYHEMGPKVADRPRVTHCNIDCAEPMPGERDMIEQFTTSTANGRAYQRRLFAADAARGMAFVDLLRQRFDVVLMNPPFGAASRPSKAYIDRAYPRTKKDLFAAFVERGLGLLGLRGMLGAITNRTGFFLTSFQEWRTEILFNESKLTTMADLGYGVLDTAMVETAAYCLTKLPSGR